MTDHDDLYGDLGAGDADVENLEVRKIHSNFGLHDVTMFTLG